MPQPDEPLFREIEHTADVGIEVEADDLPELFRRTGLALFRLMVGQRGVACRQVQQESVTADGYEALLHDWLSRLLLRFAVDGLVVREIEVTEVSPTRIDSRLFGETLDLGRHEFLTEIKAVTWHAISVVQAGPRWKARVVFDV